MLPWDYVGQPHKAPLGSLVVLFISWKLLLLSVALLSPGPGYDTSTQILLQTNGSAVNLPLQGTVAISYGEQLAHKLVRWDAIYFATISDRGYLFEQEWAFGWGLTRLLSFLAHCESFSIVTCRCQAILVFAGRSRVQCCCYIEDLQLLLQPRVISHPSA